MNATPRICPDKIECHQHGGSFRVTAQRILTHADDTKHVYLFARCCVGGGVDHEFAEYLRPAEAA